MKLTTVLGLLFLTLKLLHVINWPWWIVLLPFSIELLLYVIIFIVPNIVPGIKEQIMLEEELKRLRKKQ